MRYGNVTCDEVTCVDVTCGDVTCVTYLDEEAATAGQGERRLLNPLSLGVNLSAW